VTISAIASTTSTTSCRKSSRWSGPIEEERRSSTTRPHEKTYTVMVTFTDPASQGTYPRTRRAVSNEINKWLESLDATVRDIHVTTLVCAKLLLSTGVSPHLCNDGWAIRVSK
jgi:hypothetical protein